MAELLFAPVGTPVDGDGWVPLGHTDDDGFHWSDEPTEDGDAALSLGGQTVRMEVPVGRFSAAVFWLLFRRRHPNVTRLRSAYRRRSRARRRR
ncbi:hypothetical protein AB0B63_06920 [Micromonospora sp. NPDC049081]|uniref:hypothetical protein n=1 Tax=Micromonospora sp. NPDC049081 TaxID=3155150 RepID=UPI0033C644AC